MFGRSYEECSFNVKLTIETLERLGFIINKQKCDLIPKNKSKNKCKFLGFVINSIDMFIVLPDTKRYQILSLLRELRKKKYCLIREFASLVGCIVAPCPAIQYGWLY